MSTSSDSHNVVYSRYCNSQKAWFPDDEHVNEDGVGRPQEKLHRVEFFAWGNGHVEADTPEEAPAALVEGLQVSVDHPLRDVEHNVSHIQVGSYRVR